MSCRVCKKPGLELLIDGGALPRCFDFLSLSDVTTLSKPAQEYEFQLVQCHHCGVIQLNKPITHTDLVPTLKWISNKEPTDHFDRLAKFILSYLKDENSRVLFVSSFDEELYKITYDIIGDRAILLDAKNDLGIDQKDPGQALIQAVLEPDLCALLRKKLGVFELVVSCRLIEHAHEPRRLVMGLTEFLSQDARLIVELPDSTKALLQGDVGMLWEEHTSYFTPESLRLGFSTMGLVLDQYTSFYYPQEDAIAAVFFKENNCRALSAITGEISLGRHYSNRFHYLKKRLSIDLAAIQEKENGIVLFGAGHRSIMFVNLLNISKYLSAVVDDSEDKKGLLLPGSNLEIISSDDSVARGIGVYLLSVRLDIESKIADILSRKSKNKIICYSTSPDSPNAIPIMSDCMNQHYSNAGHLAKNAIKGLLFDANEFI